MAGWLTCSHRIMLTGLPFPATCVYGIMPGPDINAGDRITEKRYRQQPAESDIRFLCPQVSNPYFNHHLKQKI
jgi:hypothetical protein